MKKPTGCMPFQLLCTTNCRDPHLICFKYTNPAWMVLCASTVAIQVVSRKRVEFVCFLLLKFTSKLYNQSYFNAWNNFTAKQLSVSCNYSYQLSVASSLYIYSLLHNYFSFILFLIQVTELSSCCADSAFFFINASKEPEAKRKKRI